MICKQYQKQKEWIAGNRIICNHLKSINIHGYYASIESELNIPYRTLSKAINGYAKIPIKYIQPLKEYLKL